MRTREADPGMRGMTLETLVALALTAIVAFGAHVAWKSLAKGSREAERTAAMQRGLKAVTREIESDLKRAGFGISGLDAFTTLKKDEVGFIYKDLVGTYCAANDTAFIGYTAGSRSVVKRVACGGTPKADKVLAVEPDSLSLAFAYLDGTGASTGVSANVRTVEFDLVITADEAPRRTARKRSVRGSVSIVNNL